LLSDELIGGHKMKNNKGFSLRKFILLSVVLVLIVSSFIMSEKLMGNTLIFTKWGVFVAEKSNVTSEINSSAGDENTLIVKEASEGIGAVPATLEETNLMVASRAIESSNVADGSLFETAVEGVIQESPPEPEKSIGEMKVHYIDVGEGDCILITCGGHSMIIDAGSNSQGTKVQSYLKNLGITELDYVIGTHPHEDHIGGLDVVLYKFSCFNVLMPDYEYDIKSYGSVIETMVEKDYKNTLPIVGNTYSLGEAVFTIIAPNHNEYGDFINNYSIGILLQHGEKRFIFTGDVGSQAEKDIMANDIDISADVYKVNHHGSANSSTIDFLNEVNPDFAVISCGEGNPYGYPRAETLNNFRNMGIQVFRTDEQGSIIATSDGYHITWSCSPSETWQAGEPSAVE
jgi:competence protein ComEC